MGGVFVDFPLTQSDIGKPGRVAGLDTFGALAAKGYAYATNNAGTSIPTSTWTRVPFDTVVEDVDGVIGANGVITVPSGWSGRLVQVVSGVYYGSSFAGRSLQRIQKNGATVIMIDKYTSASINNASVIVSPIIRVATGDTFVCDVFQSSGGTEYLYTVTGNFMSVVAI